MSWEIKLPYRSPEDPLTAVGELTGRLETDEARVTRQLVLSGLMAGLSTAGQLMDRIKALDTTDRRRLLDASRQLAGLESIETVEARRRLKAACAAGAGTAAATSPWQLCHGEGCNATPINYLGAPIPVEVKRWFCPAHIDQAAPGDMEPRDLGLRYAPSGAIVEFDPVEEAKEAARDESRRNVREHQQADRDADAEAARIHREAREAEVRRLVPPGVPA